MHAQHSAINQPGMGRVGVQHGGREVVTVRSHGLLTRVALRLECPGGGQEGQEAERSSPRELIVEFARALEALFAAIRLIRAGGGQFSLTHPVYHLSCPSGFALTTLGSAGPAGGRRG